MQLEFSGVHLGDRGLLRIIDAANKTQTLEKLDVGILTSSGLELLAQRLTDNKSLNEIIFTETSDHQQYWTAESK